MQVVLSGMTTLEQMNENLEHFSKNDPAIEEDKALLQKVVSAMADLVPCTACRYSLPAEHSHPGRAGQVQQSLAER